MLLFTIYGCAIIVPKIGYANAYIIFLHLNATLDYPKVLVVL